MKTIINDCETETKRIEIVKKIDATEIRIIFTEDGIEVIDPRSQEKHFLKF